jgi:membrane-bound inhibitor of C-type lysozyme
MMRIILVVCTIGAIAAGLFFLFSSDKKLFSSGPEGMYEYRCAGGETFSLTPSSDAKSITLYPGEGTVFQETVLENQPSASGKRFRAGDVAVFARGEEVRVTTAGREIICHPIPNTEQAPFNWGD